MAFDWSSLIGRIPGWLPARAILLVRQGSRAYGTATATSDEDVKGVCIPPPEVVFSFGPPFEQAETHEPDLVVYDWRKFFALAAECNPGILEMLFTEDADVVASTPLGDRLRAARSEFLSRKVRHTFAGYALSQLKRIRTHRRWLEQPPAAPPTRAEFGLPERPTLTPDELGAAEAQVKRRLDEWRVELDDLPPATRIALESRLSRVLIELHLASGEERFLAAGRSIGFDTALLELLDRERRFRARMNEWRQFETWKRERNPARAQLEAKHGYDTKHAMHLVRLLRMCLEVLQTGRVVVRRPDADELLAIRRGAWTYDQLVAWADAQDRAIDEAVARSPLPPSADRVRLDALCVELGTRALTGG